MAQNPTRARNRVPSDGLLELVPEVMLPAQMDGDRERLPVERLMSAIIYEAFGKLEYGKWPSDTNAWKLADDAMKWVTSNRRGAPFTFLDICEHLALAPDVYRRIAVEVWNGRTRISRICRRTTGKSDTRRIGG